MSLDLDGYLARIGWSGPAKPDLDTLTRLLGAHMRAIPFENFDALLGRRVHLDLDSLQAKLVRGRRGGYCFEHATLFGAVLSALGFRATSHLARVVLFTPKSDSPRTHMLNLVELPDGRFAVDPGFGGPAARVPVPLIDAGTAQPKDGAGHWFTRDGEDWVLRGQGLDGPADLWVSPFSTDYAIDFELSNHYVATHPNSVFTNNIMLNVFTADGRVSLMNRDVSLRQGDTIGHWQVPDRQALVSLLVERFGIMLPEAAGVRVPAVPDWT